MWLDSSCFLSSAERSRLTSRDFEQNAPEISLAERPPHISTLPIFRAADSNRVRCPPGAAIHEQPVQAAFLVAPNNFARSNPEVRFASFAKPDRRMQGDVAAFVHGDIPVWLHFLEQHHLQTVAAAARAAQAYRPVFVSVARQHQIPER